MRGVMRCLSLESISSKPEFEPCGRKSQPDLECRVITGQKTPSRCCSFIRKRGSAVVCMPADKPRETAPVCEIWACDMLKRQYSLFLFSCCVRLRSNIDNNCPLKSHKEVRVSPRGFLLLARYCL